MPKVSVILPVYNVEKYLRECLDSILNQTLKDIEIICVNDGSTDDSLNILNEYAKKDNRFIILDQDNQGAGVARNKGLEIAKGEYIIFFDSDDYMEKDMLQKLYNNSVQYMSDISICASNELNNDTKEISPYIYSLEVSRLPESNYFSPSSIYKNIFRFCVGWPWDKLYSKSFIESNNLKFQNIRHSNDTFFVLTSLVLATKISIINEALVVHRKHNNSLESTRTKNPECFYLAMKKLYDELNKRNLYKSVEQAYVNYALEFPHWHISTMKNNKTKKIMKKYHYKLLELINFEKYNNKKYFYNKTLYKEIKNFYNEKRHKKFEKIFSINNKDIYKVIYFMGFKIKIKSKNLEQKKQINKLTKHIKKLEKDIKNLKEIIYAEN